MTGFRDDLPTSALLGDASASLFDPGEVVGTASHGIAGITAGRSPVLCRFTVFGVPVPQGGPRAVPTAQGPRLISAGGKDLKQWRQAVATEAERLALEHGRLDGALEVDIEFRFPMPKSRTKAVRDLGRYPMTVRPDVDKLLRAILDSLTVGGLIGDDRQCSTVRASKYEYLTSWTGADITLRRASVFPLEVEP